MASFTPKKIDLSKINNGQKYEVGDGISSDAINAPIEAAALLQSLATNPPDYSQAGNIGTPIIEIGGTEDSPKFVFKNIKGEKGEQGERGEKGAQGEQGIQGIQGVQGEKGQDGKDGVDGKDGHTTPAPNFLINGNFAINQREKMFYEYYNSLSVPYYVVDKWLLYEGRVVVAAPENVRLAGDANGKLSFRQYIAMPDGDSFPDEWCLSINHICTSNNFKINFYRYSRGEYTNIYQIYLPPRDIDYEDWHFSHTMPLPQFRSEELFCVEICGENLTDADMLTLKWVKLEHGNVATGYMVRPYLEELALCQETFLPIPRNTLFPAVVYSEKTADITIPLPSALTFHGIESLGRESIYNQGTWVVFGSNGKSEAFSEQVAIDVPPSSVEIPSHFINATISSDMFRDLAVDTCASVYCTQDIFVDMDIYG
jgi:hypothetical protein